MITLIAFRFSVMLSLPVISYLTTADKFLPAMTLLVIAPAGHAIVTGRLAETGHEDAARTGDRQARWVYLAALLGLAAGPDLKILGGLMTRFIATFLTILLLPLGVQAKKDKKEPPETTFDGLELVASERVDLAYVKPGADLGPYSKVLILEAGVAFRKGWEREHRGGGSIHRITARDIEKIKQGMADLLREVFVEVLEADGGYPVVEAVGDDVLLLRPAIINLDVTAPDTGSRGRSYSFTSSAGEATLFLELYDSVSGEILARVLDREVGRDYGRFRYTTRVSNSAEARRMFKQWAGQLRAALDEVHGKSKEESE